MADRMVPNPLHIRLRELLADAEERGQEIRRAYERPVGTMRTGKVWTGPTADKWIDGLEERHHRLTSLARQLVSAIEAELHRHPAMVTEAEAHAISASRVDEHSPFYQRGRGSWP
ncbi:hypothetical protein Ppa06_43980 [Planomonospora parontospora subsp. parontospora]|uniref:Uncharacterized protein n=2 Tax=Planomonospora parontospora TaxID=58119 RepID=A0AA37F6G0_9ACTN|nr:hypothetical protein [Planomonospora parontospora]GGK84671.1 hypothetical protein GCM10010126_49840 [Planomonospora parontospora]GII10600.1 hypothetical protein Ppa06_43980 [Planomonospora parontospora subsp. parontospora]